MKNHEGSGNTSSHSHRKGAKGRSAEAEKAQKLHEESSLRALRSKNEVRLCFFAFINSRSSFWENGLFYI